MLAYWWPVVDVCYTGHVSTKTFASSSRNYISHESSSNWLQPTRHNHSSSPDRLLCWTLVFNIIIAHFSANLNFIFPRNRQQYNFLGWLCRKPSSLVPLLKITLNLKLPRIIPHRLYEYRLCTIYVSTVLGTSPVNVLSRSTRCVLFWEYVMSQINCHDLWLNSVFKQILY